MIHVMCRKPRELTKSRNGNDGKLIRCHRTQLILKFNDFSMNKKNYNS